MIQIARVTIEKIQELRDKRCWLFAYGCPCRTAVCYGLPDDGCPVYIWFKELIELRAEAEQDEFGKNF